MPVRLSTAAHPELFTAMQQQPVGGVWILAQGHEDIPSSSAGRYAMARERRRGAYLAKLSPHAPMWVDSTSRALNRPLFPS